MTGGPGQAGPGNKTPAETPASGPAVDSENPLVGAGSGDATSEAPRKRGVSGLLVGGVVMAVLGVGAAGGGIGTFATARKTSGQIEEAAAPGGLISTFPQGQYDADVTDDFDRLKTLNTVTPILLAAGGALLVGGVAMIVVDRTNKKKGKGFYAQDKKVEVAGIGAAPMRGGAWASIALRF